jgi:hypothetical protein
MVQLYNSRTVKLKLVKMYIDHQTIKPNNLVSFEENQSRQTRVCMQNIYDRLSDKVPQLWNKKCVNCQKVYRISDHYF